MAKQHVKNYKNIEDTVFLQKFHFVKLGEKEIRTDYHKYQDYIEQGFLVYDFRTQTYKKIRT